jgi:hypothetical protein
VIEHLASSGRDPEHVETTRELLLAHAPESILISHRKTQVMDLRRDGAECEQRRRKEHALVVRMRGDEQDLLLRPVLGT